MALYLNGNKLLNSLVIDGNTGCVDIPMILNANKYIKDTDGTEASYNGWSDTDYIDISKYSDVYLSISYLSMNLTDCKYNAYYNSSKAFISNFDFRTPHLSVPSNAEYIRISAPTSNMQDLKVFGLTS